MERAKRKAVVVGGSKEGKVDLMGLVPAKEPRPLRKTFGTSFTPLNVRLRECMNEHTHSGNMDVFQTLCLFAFEILRNKRMRMIKMIYP